MGEWVVRGIFSSLQGWLCVWASCALQCAKHSVGHVLAERYQKQRSLQTGL